MQYKQIMTLRKIILYFNLIAGMAELVDALVSKTNGLWAVGVRFPLPAQISILTVDTSHS